jgi:hypothetical protein
MGFSSDVKVVTKTADASAVVGRTRLQGLYFTNTATASSFILRDGTTDSATAVVTINTPAAAGGTDIHIPNDGVLFENGIFIDVTNANVTSVTLIFCGGAAA